MIREELTKTKKIDNSCLRYHEFFIYPYYRGTAFDDSPKYYSPYEVIILMVKKNIDLNLLL